MRSYPTEHVPTADGVRDYAPPEALAEVFATFQLERAPSVRIVGAFNALRPQIDTLDAAGLIVLTSCAEQITLYNFGGLAAEGLATRDLARARLATFPDLDAPEV